MFLLQTLDCDVLWHCGKTAMSRTKPASTVRGDAGSSGDPNDDRETTAILGSEERASTNQVHKVHAGDC
jgi:hypothetical protein